MVVGEINGHSKNAEASRGVEIEYPRIEDLRDGQRGFIAKRSTGFKLEEGTFVVTEVKTTSLVFRPSESHADGRSKAWQVVDAAPIDQGEVRVFTEPSCLVDTTKPELLLVPVVTDNQAEFALQFSTDILSVVRWAGEGLIVNTINLEPESDDLSIAA